MLFELHHSLGYEQRKYFNLSNVITISKDGTTKHERITKTSHYDSETLAPL